MKAARSMNATLSLPRALTQTKARKPRVRNVLQVRRERESARAGGWRREGRQSLPHAAPSQPQRRPQNGKAGAGRRRVVGDYDDVGGARLVLDEGTLAEVVALLVLFDDLRQRDPAQGSEGP